MPRELKAMADEHAAPDGPHLTKSPDELDGGFELEEDEITLEDILAQRNDKRDELHPYTQTLNLSDIESCIRLEDETFPPNERCTREKSVEWCNHRLLDSKHHHLQYLARLLHFRSVLSRFCRIFASHTTFAQRLREPGHLLNQQQFQYRLSKCAELSLGIFTSHAEGNIVTAETSAPVYSGAPERKAVLLGHIVATKTTNPAVADADMDIPTSGSGNADAGHKEDGRTICIHSLAVLPGYQRKGLGKTLMKSYIQRMESHGVADRLALIAHEALIPYYESLGFENKGKSEAQFAGGGWFSMVRELKSEEEIMHEEME